MYHKLLFNQKLTLKINLLLHTNGHRKIKSLVSVSDVLSISIYYIILIVTTFKLVNASGYFYWSPNGYTCNVFMYVPSNKLTWKLHYYKLATRELWVTSWAEFLHISQCSSHHVLYGWILISICLHLGIRCANDSGDLWISKVNASCASIKILLNLSRDHKAT